MQLIRCYIDNFGKLSDLSLDFRSDRNLLCRENGWGKSTLAVFICAMFYGLGNDKKHGETDNERKHYQPWQGGCFGGNLTFSDSKSQYTIYRTFGSKPKEDTFELREAATNLLSTAYSEKVGEELFQIDRDSFVRTAILYQNSCDTFATSEINAKIHNLAEDTNDMNNFDRVNKKLLSELNALGENRSTGQLARLKNQEAILGEEVRKGQVVDCKIQELVQRKEQALTQLREAEKKQEILLQIQGQIDYYHALDEMREREKICESAETVCMGPLPGREELERQRKLERTIEKLKDERKKLSFSRIELMDLENLDLQFAEVLPDNRDIEEQRENLERIRELEIKMAGSGLPEEDEETLAHYQACFGETEIEDLIPDSMFDEAIAWWYEKENSDEQDSLPKKILRLFRQSVEKVFSSGEALKGKKYKKPDFHPVNYFSEHFTEIVTGICGIFVIVIGIVLILLSLGLLGNLLVLGGAGIIVFVIFRLIGGEQKVLERRKNFGKTKVPNRRASEKIEMTDLGEEHSEEKDDEDFYDEDFYEEESDDEDFYEEESDEGESDEEEFDEEDFYEEEPDEDDSDDEFYDYADVKEDAYDEDDLNGYHDEEEPRDWEPIMERFFENSDLSYGSSETLQILNHMKYEYKEYRRLMLRKLRSINPELKEEYEDLLNQVMDFLSTYTDRKIAVSELDDVLEGIRLDTIRYQELSLKCEQFEEITWRLRKCLRKQNIWFSTYHFEDEQNAEEQLNTLGSAVDYYDNCKRECERARTRVVELRQKMETELGKNFDENNYSAEKLARSLKANSDLLIQCQNLVNNCENELTALTEQKGVLSEKNQELESLREEIKNKKHEYEVIRLTQEILSQAQTNFTITYMEPIMTSFMEYYRMIDKEEKASFMIDADSRITVLGGGLQRDTRVLSQAYQDMVGLCIRLALLDAMYPGEKPFILMDDSLANFDDMRLQGGFDFLARISEKYQVIYLTCHEQLMNI